MTNYNKTKQNRTETKHSVSIVSKCITFKFKFFHYNTLHRYKTLQVNNGSRKCYINTVVVQLIQKYTNCTNPENVI